jgi:hypothetical protein
MQLDKRQCDIGTKIQTRREFHGDEKVPAIDLKITGVSLSKDELCELLDEETAWDDRYIDNGKESASIKGRRIENSEKLNVDFKESQAILTLGLNESVVAFINCTIRKIELVKVQGGLTTMNFMIQSSEEVKNAEMIRSFLDTRQSISLILGSHDTAEETDEDDAQESLRLNVDEVAKDSNVKRERIDVAKRRNHLNA